MPVQVAVQSASLEEKVERLRYHWTHYVGYAFALAQRAGMSPEEAARLWMEPFLSGREERPERTPQELERWVRENAAAMQIFHGNARLEREGNIWIMRVSLEEDRQNLELWGAALDFFGRWAGEQVRLLGTVQGFKARGWLEGETMCFRFEVMEQQEGA